MRHTASSAVLRLVAPVGPVTRSAAGSPRKTGHAPTNRLAAVSAGREMAAGAGAARGGRPGRAAGLVFASQSGF